MKEFLDSPYFVVIAILVGVAAIVITVLVRNTSWTARGITPSRMLTGLKSKKMLYILGVAVIALGGVWLWTAFTVPDLVDLPRMVWAHPYAVLFGWLVLAVATAILVVLGVKALGENKDAAAALKKAGVIAQKAYLVIVVMLFGGILLFGHVAVETGLTTFKRVSCPDLSAREGKTCVINTSWSNP